MIFTELTKKALVISFNAHKEQRDKAGMPYVYHPYRVAEQMRDEYSTCAALLHDVVEDGGSSFEALEQVFPPEVMDALRLLTHDKSVPYLDYVRKIKTNPISTAVKLADLADNSNPDRLGALTQEDRTILEKYHKARVILSV